MKKPAWIRRLLRPDLSASLGLDLRAGPMGVALLRRAITIGQGAEDEFQPHEDDHDQNGQSHPTQGSKDFVAHVRSPRFERWIAPAGSERLRRLAPITPNSTDILTGSIAIVYSRIGKFYKTPIPPKHPPEFLLASSCLSRTTSRRRLKRALREGIKKHIDSSFGLGEEVGMRRLGKLSLGIDNVNGGRRSAESLRRDETDVRDDNSGRPCKCF